ncbi:MAG: GNAT family N-acetyltransferase [Woeseiaceae bacterium]|nr:GNAT family N-acetyltransferase [Woeseiaceae bacterium]
MNASRTLATERLDLRWLTEDDAELMLGVWNDPAFVRFVGDRGVRSLDQARTALREGALKLYADFGYGPYRVATRDEDRPMGVCGLFKREHLADPDIGFGLLPEFCRQGYAYEAAVAVLEHAQGVLQLNRVTAIVSPENEASIGLIDKLGLQFVERMRMPGEDHDVLLYAIEWPS